MLRQVHEKYNENSRKEMNISIEFKGSVLDQFYFNQ